MKFGEQKCDLVAETWFGRQSHKGVARKPDVQPVGVSVTPRLVFALFRHLVRLVCAWFIWLLNIFNNNMEGGIFFRSSR